MAAAGTTTAGPMSPPIASSAMRMSLAIPSSDRAQPLLGPRPARRDNSGFGAQGNAAHAQKTAPHMQNPLAARAAPWGLRPAGGTRKIKRVVGQHREFRLRRLVGPLRRPGRERRKRRDRRLALFG